MTTPATYEALDFVVRRDDVRVHACWPVAWSRAHAGQVLLRVDRFGFTANNITYVTLGDRLSYWSFFPAADGWGRIPVWGFATVLESACDGIAAGERFFGYYPMSSHVVMEPTRVTPVGFVDGIGHRRELPPLYNHYIRTTADPTYAEATESEHVLLRPLFITSFALDDWLFDNALFGARAVLISSASSKTAYGLAFLLTERKRREGGAFEVIGLTSRKNRPFVERLGTYETVVTYEDVASLPPDTPAVLVDLTGDARLVGDVHRHYGERLRCSSSVGFSHWEAVDRDEPKTGLPGARSELFFAPTQIRKRSVEWGAAEFQRRFASALHRFVAATRDPARSWLRIVEAGGPEAVARVYLDTLEGRVTPDQGHVLSLLPP
jgi:Protein of unknown function (DUF2855)